MESCRLGQTLHPLKCHLVYERAQQGVGSLAAQEALRVVQEDLVEAVEDVLQQQAALLLAIVIGVEEQRLCKKEANPPSKLDSWETAALPTNSCLNINVYININVTIYS